MLTNTQHILLTLQKDFRLMGNIICSVHTFSGESNLLSCNWPSWKDKRLGICAGIRVPGGNYSELSLLASQWHFWHIFNRWPALGRSYFWQAGIFSPCFSRFNWFYISITLLSWYKCLLIKYLASPFGLCSTVSILDCFCVKAVN